MSGLRYTAKLLFVLACILHVRGQQSPDAQCLSPRPVDANSDPAPGTSAGAFGRSEGSQHELAELNDTEWCEAYRKNLEKQADVTLHRHSSTVFIDNSNCTVTKLVRKPIQNTNELYWSGALSGRPHFMTLLASHDEPACQAQIFANEWDARFPADWTRPWPHYRQQLDEIIASLVEVLAVPRDVSMSQVIMAGANITLIDYEDWMQLEPNEKYVALHTRDTLWQQTAICKLELAVWLEWLKEGTHMQVRRCILLRSRSCSLCL